MPNPISEPISEEAIRAWCVAYLAKALRLRPERIGHDQDFAGLGLDSAESLFMVTAAEDWSGLELGSETAIEHPSVAAFSRFLMSLLRQHGRAAPGER